MPEWNGYDTLEISGNMLMPGFSIYLLEISNGDMPYYYIGMTGDIYYPSARAAFHRMSGHLELSEHSKQNQLRTAIKEQMGISDDNFVRLHIKMHYFPILGFTKWDGKVSEFDKGSVQYVAYKQQQQQIQALEDTIIYSLKKILDGRLLNKTRGIKAIDRLNGFEQILTDITNIVKIEKYNEY